MIGHIVPKPQYLPFQIILKHNGLQRVTDVPLAGLDIVRVALEAEAQNLGMTQPVTMAIKKGMIEEILREPQPGRRSPGAPGYASPSFG
jgi:hypothetical protein